MNIPPPLPPPLLLYGWIDGCRPSFGPYFRGSPGYLTERSLTTNGQVSNLSIKIYLRHLPIIALLPQLLFTTRHSHVHDWLSMV
jgi:hypothetical protein